MKNKEDWLKAYKEKLGELNELFMEHDANRLGLSIGDYKTIRAPQATTVVAAGHFVASLSSIPIRKDLAEVEAEEWIQKASAVQSHAFSVLLTTVIGGIQDQLDLAMVCTAARMVSVVKSDPLSFLAALTAEERETLKAAIETTDFQDGPKQDAFADAIRAFRPFLEQELERFAFHVQENASTIPASPLDVERDELLDIDTSDDPMVS